MRAIAADDKSAEAIVSADRAYNAMLRTTCVATLLTAGHAINALPQRATASVNCRLIPGETAEDVQAALERTVAGLGLKVTRMTGNERTLIVPPTAGIHGLNERISVNALYRGRDYLYELIKYFAAS